MACEHAGVRWVAICHGDNHVHIMATLARQDGGRARLSRERVIVGEVMRWAEAARWTSDPAERAKYQLQAAPRRDRTAAKRPTRAEAEKARRNQRAEAPRVTLRRMVQAAAAGARTEAEFADRLAEVGGLIKWRTSPSTGEVTGYAAGLPGDLTAARPGSPARQLWYSGGKLAPDLTWPKLRARWSGPRLSGQAMTPGAARAVMAREVTQAARAARTEAEFAAAWPGPGCWSTGGPDRGQGRTGPARAIRADRGGPAHPDRVRGQPARPHRTGRAARLGRGRGIGPHLTLGAMRARWAAGRPGRPPGQRRRSAGRTGPPSTPTPPPSPTGQPASCAPGSPPGGPPTWRGPPPTSSPPPTRPPATRACGTRPRDSSGQPARRGAASRPAPRPATRSAPPPTCYAAASAATPSAPPRARPRGPGPRGGRAPRQQRRHHQAAAARAAAQPIQAPARAAAFRPQRPVPSVREAARRVSGPQARRGRGRSPRVPSAVQRADDGGASLLPGFRDSSRTPAVTAAYVMELPR